MKKILLITLLFCLPYVGYSQIGVFENFNQGLPPGWQGNTGAGNFLVDDVASCEGQSARVTLTGFFLTNAELTSKNIVGQSNGTEFTLNFDYKVIDSQDESAFPAGWGTAEVQYSLDNGATWTTFGTIDDNNHVVSDECAAAPEFTIPAADLAAGSDFKLRWLITKNADNFRFYIDNVSGSQVLNSPPNCTELNNINNGQTDVSVTTGFSWSEPDGLPAGYKISIGTTSGGTDVADNVDVGPSLTYTPANTLEFSTDYYVTVIAYNSVGDAVGCNEIMFTTEDDPFDVATEIVPNEGNFCVDIVSSTLNGTNASSFDVSCGGPAVQEVWFQFTATSDQHIATILNGGFAISHAVYDGQTSQELFCSEEFDNLGNSDAVVMTDLTIGNTYYIRVFSDSVSNSDFDLCLTTPQFGEDNETCADAAPFCAPYDDDGNAEPLVFPNGYFYLNETVSEDGPDYGCLYSQPNPAWYFVQIQESGNISFNITQNTAFDGDGNPIGDGLDVDFIAYGPFDDPEGQCGAALDSSVEVDCSYSAEPVEDFTINNAQEGEYYLVLITNYNQSPGYISFGQTNFGDSGAGSTNCDLVFNSTVKGCPGETVTLTSEFIDEHEAFQWSYYDGATDSYIPINGASSAVYEVTESGEYLLQSYDEDTNYTEEREYFTVEFQPEPDVTVPANMSLCDGETLILDATLGNVSDYNEVNYQWMLDGNDIAGETSSTLNISEDGDYSVLIETINSSATSNPHICETLIEFPVQGGDFIVDIGQDETFCDAGTQTITATITDGDAVNATYLWSTGETTESIDVSTSGVYEVKVTIDGCSVTESVEYIFNESPVVDLGETNIVSCDITTEVIDATPSNYTDAGVTYEWYLDGSLITSETTATLSPSSYGEYKVIVTPNGTNCAFEGTVAILERDDLGVEITSSLDPNMMLNYCEDNTGNPVMPEYESVLTAELINADESEVTYKWFKNGNEISGETSSTITVTYQNDGVYTDDYTVEISIQTCTATSSALTTNVEISPYENAGCKITQGLSPDETPGENDKLDLAFLNDRSGIESLEVFDRNGRSVFSQNNYVDEFNGQNNDGDKLVGGTYFYVIKLKKQDPVFGNEKKGWIYIKRK